MAAEQREHSLDMSLKEWKSLRIKVASIGHGVGAGGGRREGSVVGGGGNAGGSPHTPQSQTRPVELGQQVHLGSASTGGSSHPSSPQAASHPQAHSPSSRAAAGVAAFASPNNASGADNVNSGRDLFSPDSLQGTHDRDHGHGEGQSPRGHGGGARPRGGGGGSPGGASQSAMSPLSPHKNASTRHLYSPTYAGSQSPSYSPTAARAPGTPPTPLFDESGGTVGTMGTMGTLALGGGGGGGGGGSGGVDEVLTTIEMLRQENETHQAKERELSRELSAAASMITSKDDLIADLEAARKIAADREVMLPPCHLPPAPPTTCHLLDSQPPCSS